MDSFFVRIQKANAAAGYKRKLFSVDYPGLGIVWVWAWSVSDAIRFMCPNMDASYSDITGQGAAWVRGENETIFFREVK